MTTAKQKTAAQKNIQKAQEAWQSMSPRQRALAQPQGRGRAKVGTKGEGEYYRIIVRPKSEFVTFRYHDVGEPGNILRLVGKRQSGSWDDHAWLIDKDMAQVSNGHLESEDADAKDILEMVGPVEHVKGDIFQGHPRRNVPEKEKPTLAQQKARTANIKKAQSARKQ